MNNHADNHAELSESPGFTIRAAAVAVTVSLFLLGSSIYIALKLGALPWPIIFSVMISAGLLKMMSGRTRLDLHEINVAQAGASIGGLIAAGVAFTLPGIIYLQSTSSIAISWPSPWLLSLQIAIAGLLGIFLSVPLKKAFIDEEQLPYPSGTAGAELLRSGAGGGPQLRLMLTTAAIAAIFALTRDYYFPQGFSIDALVPLGLFITLLPLPLAIGSGYILGPRASYSWLIGALIGWGMIIPLLHYGGTDGPVAIAMTQNAGMGIVMGAGVGFFVVYLLPRLPKLLSGIQSGQRSYLKIIPLAVLLSATALIIGGVPVVAAVMAIITVMMMVAIAARMTGETNINPLEQFAIFAVIGISLLYSVLDQEIAPGALMMMATFIAVACAVAGDAGQDFKSAVLLKTRFSDIIKVDVVTVLVAGLAAPFFMEAIRNAFGDQFFTEAMPAVQARLVASSLFGFQHPAYFYGGFFSALIVELIMARFSRHQNKLSQLMLLPLGIGMFLGPGLAIPIAAGAAICQFIKTHNASKYMAGMLIAAAVMGGEGIAGFGNAALISVGISPAGSSATLGGICLLILMGTMFRRRAV